MHEVLVNLKPFSEHNLHLLSLSIEQYNLMINLKYEAIKLLCLLTKAKLFFNSIELKTMSNKYIYVITIIYQEP